MKMQRSGCLMFETKATLETLEFNLSSAVHSPVVQGVPGATNRRILKCLCGSMAADR